MNNKKKEKENYGKKKKNGEKERRNELQQVEYISIVIRVTILCKCWLKVSPVHSAPISRKKLQLPRVTRERWCENSFQIKRWTRKTAKVLIGHERVASDAVMIYRDRYGASSRRWMGKKSKRKATVRSYQPTNSTRECDLFLFPVCDRDDARCISFEIALIYDIICGSSRRRLIMSKVWISLPGTVLCWKGFFFRIGLCLVWKRGLLVEWTSCSTQGSSSFPFGGCGLASMIWENRQLFWCFTIDWLRENVIGISEAF